MIWSLRTDMPTHGCLSVQSGSTPLHECAFNDFEDAADMLIKAGCKVDETNMVSVSSQFIFFFTSEYASGAAF